MRKLSKTFLPFFLVLLSSPAWALWPTITRHGHDKTKPSDGGNLGSVNIGAAKVTGLLEVSSNSVIVNGAGGSVRVSSYVVLSPSTQAAPGTGTLWTNAATGKLTFKNGDGSVVQLDPAYIVLTNDAGTVGSNSYAPIYSPASSVIFDATEANIARGVGVTGTIKLFSASAKTGNVVMTLRLNGSNITTCTLSSVGAIVTCSASLSQAVSPGDVLTCLTPGGAVTTPVVCRVVIQPGAM